MAFFPGKIVHTNEILCLIGNNYYVENSAKQATEVACRRIEYVEQIISDYQNKLKELNDAMEMFRIDSEEVMDIREEYNENDQLSKTKNVSKPTKLSSDKEKKEDLEFIKKIADMALEEEKKDYPQIEKSEPKLKVEKRVSFSDDVGKEKAPKEDKIIKEKVIAHDIDQIDSESIDMEMLAKQVREEYVQKLHERKSINEAKNSDEFQEKEFFV